MWLHTGFNHKEMLEQSCRALSCALGAQEDAHRVGTCSSSLCPLCSAWRQTVTLVPAGTGPAPIRAGTSTVNAFQLKELFF